MCWRVGRACAWGNPIQTKSSDNLRVFLSGSLTGFPLETYLNSTHTFSVIPATIGTDLLNTDPTYLASPTLLEAVRTVQETRAAAPAKCGGKRDLYTVSEDGHFVGDDGFVVPRSFKEFFESHPRYVRSRVRLFWPKASGAECEDRESELLIFLMTLPEKSKFRAQGYNGFPQGCRDRIQTFSPDHAYGASKPRFLNYVKMVLTNHCISLSAKASSDPVQRHSMFSLYSLDPSGVVIDEEYINVLSGGGGAFGIIYDQMIENRILVDQFLSFVKTYNPELLVIIRAIQMTDSFVEAQHALGFPSRLFTRARNRLKALYANFEKGTMPPRQRKVYPCRTLLTRCKHRHSLEIHLAQ